MLIHRKATGDFKGKRVELTKGTDIDEQFPVGKNTEAGMFVNLDSY